LELFLTWTAGLITTMTDGNNFGPVQQAEREVALAAVDDVQHQGGKF
jgi:hypothetical protein